MNNDDKVTFDDNNNTVNDVTQYECEVIIEVAEEIILSCDDWQEQFFAEIEASNSHNSSTQTEVVEEIVHGCDDPQEQNFAEVEATTSSGKSPSSRKKRQSIRKKRKRSAQTEVVEQIVPGCDNRQEQHLTEVEATTSGKKNSKPRKRRERRIRKKAQFDAEKPKSRRPKTYRKHADPKKWFRNLQQQNRVHGKEYINRKGEIKEAKTSRYLEKCLCKYNCADHFNEKLQRKLFDDYRDLPTSIAQKSYLSGFITEGDVVRKRPRKNIPKKAKKNSREYYLPLQIRRIRVCQNFFCFIFQISPQMIVSISKRRSPTGALVDRDHGLRGRTPKNATSDSRLRLVREHINSFPKVPSHYCRKDSKKLYLAPELNISLLYRLYVEFCDERKETPVKEHVYRNVFKSYSPELTFYHPKKDRCTFCSGYESIPEPSDELKTKHQAHKLREKYSLRMKSEDMENSSTTHRVLTFDMEATLSIPYSGESIIFYKRKLSLYNFTIYDGEANGYSYLYDETNGSKGCNEVATALFSYFKQLPATINEITTWSDTCSAQNRNYHLLCMLIYAVNVIDHLNIINCKYLESGHTYLECDSMHACIERKKRSRQIYSVSEMRMVIENARVETAPYSCKIQHFSEVLDFKGLSRNIVKNRSKNTIGDTVSWLNLKWIQVRKGSPVVRYKYDYYGPFLEFNVLASPTTGSLPVRGKNKDRELPDFGRILLGSAYEAALPISVAKKNDLVDLVKTRTIPSAYKDDYTNLPSSTKVKDSCPVDLTEDLIMEVEEETVFFSE